MATQASKANLEGWFPTGKNSDSGWRLDIVSLLTIIGESAMAEHSQIMTASWLCVLPRIIPAPQVLLKPTRPTRLPQVNAIVIGVENGVKIETLNYFPNILHPIESLGPFAFRVYAITHSQKTRSSSNKVSSDANKPSRLPAPVTTSTNFANSNNNVIQRPIKRGTMHSALSMVRRVTHSNEEKVPPHVPAQRFSPLNILSIFSFALTVGLFAWSLVNRDGVACLALVAVSLASSIVGFASKWQPQLMRRSSSSNVPKGDVVIRTREGAFIVVRCDENVARELYSGTEECKYTVENVKLYRMLVGIGTFLLMVSVVLLGNCNFTLQAAIGVSYILLNGLFWGAALLSKRTFWDVSLYEFKDLTPPDGLIADQGDPHDLDPEKRPSFTRTMWYAIRETEEVGWVRKSGAAPQTDEWDTWLRQARNEIKFKRNRDWRAVEAKDSIVGQSDPGDPATTSPVAAATVNGITLPGGQQAPAEQVLPEKRR